MAKQYCTLLKNQLDFQHILMRIAISFFNLKGKRNGSWLKILIQ